MRKLSFQLLLGYRVTTEISISAAWASGADVDNKEKDTHEL